MHEQNDYVEMEQRGMFDYRGGQLGGRMFGLGLRGHHCCATRCPYCQEERTMESLRRQMMNQLQAPRLTAINLQQMFAQCRPASSFQPPEPCYEGRLPHLLALTLKAFQPKAR